MAEENVLPFMYFTDMNLMAIEFTEEYYRYIDIDIINFKYNKYNYSDYFIES